MNENILKGLTGLTLSVGSDTILGTQNAVDAVLTGQIIPEPTIQTFVSILVQVIIGISTLVSMFYKFKNKK